MDEEVNEPTFFVAKASSSIIHRTKKRNPHEAMNHSEHEENGKDMQTHQAVSALQSSDCITIKSSDEDDEGASCSSFKPTECFVVETRVSEMYLQPTASTSKHDATVPMVGGENTFSSSHNFKLSKSLSQTPKKFKIGKEPSCSPSPKKSTSSPKRRLIKNSPVRYLKNKSPSRINNHRGPSCHSSPKQLTFDEMDSGSGKGSKSIESSTLDHINANNYCKILTGIIENEDTKMLFADDELKVIQKFIMLPRQSKELYVRMYCRKIGWHRVANIQYKNISNDLLSVFKDLEKAGLVSFDYANEYIGSMLLVLQFTELKTLCKELNLSTANTKCNKSTLVTKLLNFASHQMTLNFKPSNNQLMLTSSMVVMRSVKKILKDCITLTTTPRLIFRRVMLLYSLHRPSFAEEREDIGQLLLTMHMVSIGSMAFPTCTVIPHKIFESKDQFYAFEAACELETAIREKIDLKEYSALKELINLASARLLQIINDDSMITHDLLLPTFLRKFTAGSTCTYAMSIGVEALKSDVSSSGEATIILKTLLSQKAYLVHYRGKWYEQLAIIYQHKFKNISDAAKVVLRGLQDDLLYEVWQHTLYDRAKLIVKRKAWKPVNQVKRSLEELLKTRESLAVAKSVVIKSKSLNCNKPGFKRVYVQTDVKTEETTYSSVEEFALSHYRTEGFSRGMHCEGIIIVSLFGIYFWDIIYDLPIPGVFQSTYQSSPLDLTSSDFYDNRRDAIDKRVSDMVYWEDDECKSAMEKVFEEHQGKVSIVNWEKLACCCHAVDIVKCIGISVLARICLRLAKEFRVAQSGFPDLIVWSPGLRKCKFVEVKGQNDHLSVKQRLWLSYLIKMGAQVEVCLVKQ